MSHSKNNIIISLLVMTLVMTFCSSCQTLSKPVYKKPNIIIIFADDQGYQDVGCYGSPLIKTPHLDRMAKEGIRFTDFYSASPVCSPSRAALLTGCYPPRVSISNVLFPWSKYGLNPDEITIAELLKNAGYATACIGKWHLGHKKPFLPTRHGFDTFYGIPYSNDMFHDPMMELADDCKFNNGMTAGKTKSDKPQKDWVALMRDEKVIEFPCDQTTITKRYTNEAIRFIKENQKKPFFLYLPHTMPHVPLFTAQEFKGISKRGLYGDVIEEMDWSVGQILKTLKEYHLDDNTLVIYTSDNGPWLEYGKDGGSALPLREGKFTTYEGGMRVPCIMRWPNQLPENKVCNQVASTVDFLPTIASITRSTLPTERAIDGKNILSLMKNPQSEQSPHQAYYYTRRLGKLEAIRVGDWKLRIAVPHKEGDENDPNPEEECDDEEMHELDSDELEEMQPQKPIIELYNLKTDIGENINLAEKHPSIVKLLSAQMESFDKELQLNKRPSGHLK